MNPSPASNRSLRIEALETRTLLAGAADPFGLVADYNAVVAAVSGQGDFSASFSTNFGNHQLVLTGTADTTLTIDLDKLPDFVTNLDISNFGSVTFIGHDDIATMRVSNVDKIEAPNLTITGALQANKVDFMEVGDTGVLSVLTFTGDKTELKVGNFGDGSTIVSSLGALTLSTQDDLVLFVAAATSDHPDQYLYLKDYNAGLIVDPDGILRSNIRDWSPAVDHPVTPDDPATPDTPVPPDSPTDPITPEPPTEPHEPGFVIVDLPLDEHMRTFVMELRSLLASSSGDIDELIAQYVAHRDQSSLPLAIVADGTSHFGGFTPSGMRGNVSTPLPAPSIPGFTIPAADGLHGPVLPDDLQSLGMTPELPALAVKEFDMHFGAVAPLDLGATAVGLALPTSRAARQGEATARPMESEPTLAESVRALGSYIAERVTAEFTPGQQSFVLLVDPPPSRGLAGAKKALVERGAPAAPATVTLTSPTPELI
ncbi:hypothetical protein [Opitutus terrae]|uniref:Uncharacterized protein n=1 Tax=Opitutus terrae (strain DSM 11246 / JCM 15787 / PB90-1) TaxID=452637 RepID=B1ZZQ8_OPITP|nr:hypothetical protein [Opitutus terrae]ACB77244.1 hypothetical protein Oter_3970 [Opitutus terrae PB90-1]